MAEAAIKAYSKEADRLFQRGVAAAKGGQRRIAAGLLTRAVQLDPRHETAWLWLSGVLDDPQDILFCLRAALKINPQNQRALAALQWIEQRRGAAATAPATPTSTIRSIELDLAPAPQHEPETPYWVQFRESLREQFRRRVKQTLAVAALMIVVIGTGNIYNARRAIPLLPAVTPQPALPEVVIQEVEAAPVPQVISTSPEVGRSEILGYLSQIENIRSMLTIAQDEYRQSSTSGFTGIEQTTAARAYRDQLRSSYTALAAIQPPGELKEAHGEYLSGLQLEQAAIEDMLQYYSEANLALANRAALRLQEANAYMAQARAVWQAYGNQIAAQAPASPFNAR